MAISIMVVVGTRPEIIKMAPVVRAIEGDPDLDLVFVHSGQHYDYGLSRRFIDELELPDPEVNLDVGSGTHAEQTSRMLVGFEKALEKFCPDVVLVEGDTNTVVAAGLAAVKLRVPLGHVEAGLRSFDRTMPEEVNRRLVGVCAELHFAPTERAAINLLHEGIPPHKIHVTGNTIVDSCLQNLEIANRKSMVLNHFGLTDDEPFATVTVHRPENVDDKASLERVVRILLSLDGCKLIFPVHPRTRRSLEGFGLMGRLKDAENLVLSGPLGHLDFLKLLSGSAFVLTDSGGVQEEAVSLKVPCLTLRCNTERPETVEVGANRLVGLDRELTLKYVDELLNGSGFIEKVRRAPNPYGDGNAGRRIVELAKSACLSGLTVPSSSFLEAGSASYRLLKVGGDLAGKTLGEVSVIENALIMLIYDQEGKPRFPDTQDVVREGWNLVLFGEFLDN